MPQESHHNGHILLLTFPAQGHINPSVQFAKRLVKMGVEVTFVTTVFAHRRMPIGVGGATKGLNFVTFSDGYDDGYKMADDPNLYMSEIRSRGTQVLKEIIGSSAEQGRPISCLVYTLLLAWAVGVARDMHVPVALLWIQPATVLDIYYYYFNEYHEALGNCSNDPSWSVELPGLPLLHAKDLPSFILPTNHDAYSFALVAFKEQIEVLNDEKNPKVLVNSFDALEPDALKAIDKLKLIAVGPVIPSAYLDGKDPSDTSVGADLFKKSRNYSDWLNSKAKGTVVYVSFGSLLEWPKPQMEEIARGLIKSNRPFMWVIRKKDDEKEEKENELSCMEELEQLGMIVPWCSQLEVLSHKAVGCFLTHCGWNSTLESLASGVPVVTFPKWTDQGTNAKLIEDVWKTGVRVKANEEGFVDGDEITRCLEMVMEGEEYRKNAMKWRDLVREATKEGGSSDKNLRTFVEEIGKKFVLS